AGAVQCGGGFLVLRNRQALRQDARLQGDDGPAAGEGLGHLLPDPDRVGHPAVGHRSGPAATRAPAAHATRSASPGEAPVARAARNTPSKASPAPVGSASTTGSPS